jgi:uncharacterized repeat protein (TIGR02543 family)
MNKNKAVKSTNQLKGRNIMSYTRLKAPIGLTLVVLLIATVMTIPVFSSEGKVYAEAVDVAYTSGNTVTFSNPILAGRALTMTIKGDNQGLVQTTNGSSKFLPYHYEMERGDYEYEGHISTHPQSTTSYSSVSLTPRRAGTYKLEIDYMYYQYIDNSNDGVSNGTWQPNSSLKYTLVKYVNVTGAVKLKGNGGKVYGSTTKYYASGSNYGALPDASRRGYKFKGWFTQKFGGKKIKSNTKVSFSGISRNLYAQWNRKVKINFSANKGYYVSKKSKTVTYSNKYGKLPKAKRSGYKFKGWYTEKSGGKRVKSSYYVKKNKRHTLYAHWTKKSSTTSDGLIGAAKAKRIALDRTGGGNVVKCHLEYDDGIRIYDIEIIKGDYEYSIDVNANTGKIVEYDRDSVYDD